MARIALPGAVEIRSACLRVSSENVLHLVQRRTSQRIVDALLQEMRQIRNLRQSKSSARRGALRGMPFAQNGPDLASESIVQHGNGSHQIRTAFGTASLCPVTSDALGDVSRLSTIGGSRIDDLLVGRPGALR